MKVMVLKHGTKSPTVGAFILGVGIAIGVYQFVTAAFNKKLKPAGKNPLGCPHSRVDSFLTR
jgi:heme/copper-type cytochrome/quinol oxidase subunit 1